VFDLGHNKLQQVNYALQYVMALKLRFYLKLQSHPRLSQIETLLYLG
jgi:hypothetical protein